MKPLAEGKNLLWSNLLNLRENKRQKQGEREKEKERDHWWHKLLQGKRKGRNLESKSTNTLVQVCVCYIHSSNCLAGMSEKNKSLKKHFNLNKLHLLLISRSFCSLFPPSPEQIVNVFMCPGSFDPQLLPPCLVILKVDRAIAHWLSHWWKGDQLLHSSNGPSNCVFRAPSPTLTFCQKKVLRHSLISPGQVWRVSKWKKWQLIALLS